MNLKQFKYWLRINGFRPEQFGTGTKWNPIRLKSRKDINLTKEKMERDDIEKAENKPALIEYTHRDGSCGYLVVPNPQEVKEAIDRWAYIEDLIPNKED